MLRMDHSLLGGTYTSPPHAAGQSVYTAFHLQAAALLLRPPEGASNPPPLLAKGHKAEPPRALFIGLGVGTALQGFQVRGRRLLLLLPACPCLPVSWPADLPSGAAPPTHTPYAKGE